MTRLCPAERHSSQLQGVEIARALGATAAVNYLHLTRVYSVRGVARLFVQLTKVSIAWVAALMPGLMRCRARWPLISLLYFSSCAAACGLGPIKDMSPRSTSRI